jgi:hypothetical protein
MVILEQDGGFRSEEEFEIYGDSNGIQFSMSGCDFAASYQINKKEVAELIMKLEEYLLLNI